MTRTVKLELPEDAHRSHIDAVEVLDLEALVFRADAEPAADQHTQADTVERVGAGAVYRRSADRLLGSPVDHAALAIEVDGTDRQDQQASQAGATQLDIGVLRESAD